MKTIEELKNLFTIKGTTTQKIEEEFDEIAKALFNEFAIKTDEKTYLFKDIEFYYYSKYHPDIITHPRNSKPMSWYINDFGGIDLNFASSIKRVSDSPLAKYILDDEAYFGGILIRELISEDKKIELNSPLKVAELFRKFDACEYDKSYPQIVARSSQETIDYQRELRKNLTKNNKVNPDQETVARKVSNILYVYDKENIHQADVNNLEKSFLDFVNSLYRFRREN